MTELHRKLWAKSPDKSVSHDEGESLLDHTLNVARVANEICRRLPFASDERERLTRLLTEAAMYHDLGKAAFGFQTMVHGGEMWKHRHETLSTALARVLNPNFDKCALFAVLTHHRSIPHDGIADGEKCLPPPELPPRFGGLANDTEWRALCDEVRVNWEELRDLLRRLTNELNLKMQSINPDISLLDLGIENKWLSRDFRKQQTIAREDRWRASLLRGLLITSDHIASAIDPRTKTHPQPLDIPQLKNYTEAIKQNELPKGATLLPFQQRAANTTGNAILKAPTGSGKTLAALLWAAHNQTENGRFFYVLPYTASINAMTDRLKLIFDKTRDDKSSDSPSSKQSLVGVLHHRNASYLFRSMEEDEGNARLRNKEARLLASLAREMYHPMRVCTPHQILRFALCGRGWETGLSEFPRACFVFDEIHAFEPLFAGLTLATVRMLKSEPFNAHILFASATIPRFLENIIREEIGIDDANIIEPDSQNAQDKIVCDKIRHCIEVRSGNLLDDLNAIADEIKSSGETALIVCNHVATSQQAFKYLRDECRFSDIMLLHSRFNGKDRNHIEKRITGKQKPQILVATQAVEVSLDIDYDRGYIEPAPADALGQRLGRINRKGAKHKPAEVVIYEEPSNGYLYDETLTARTVDLMRAVEKLTEAQLTNLVDEVYQEGYPTAAMENFKRGLNNESIRNFAGEIIAGTHRRWTDQILDASDGQIEVLPDVLQNEFDLLRKGGRYIESNQLLVPLRIGQKFKAEKLGRLFHHEDLQELVTTVFYSSSLGLDFGDASDNLL